MNASKIIVEVMQREGCGLDRDLHSSLCREPFSGCTCMADIADLIIEALVDAGLMPKEALNAVG